MKKPSLPHAFKEGILPAGAQLLQTDDPVSIGGHRLVGRLRSSGSCIVYLACDGAALVTIKTTNAAADHAVVRSRLRAEAACARRLPSVCSGQLLHDRTEQTPPYLVSEYLEGPTLEQVIDVVGPLAPRLVRSLAADLARVLAAVHDAGVLHGNLTPGNVILTKDGARLIDFGLAQQIRPSAEPADVGAVADNPGWLAPELLTGEAPGSACDVFGWGCLVGYAATGHSPATPSADDRPLDDALGPLLEASITDESGDRPTAADLAARLDAHTVSAHDHRPATVTRPEARRARPVTPRRLRRTTRAAFSALVTLAASVLLITPTATGPHRAPPPQAAPIHPAPPITSHPATLYPRQGDPRPARPKPTAHRERPTSEFPHVVGVSWLRHALRSWAAVESNTPRHYTRTSCAHVRSRRCARTQIRMLSAPDRSPRWSIRWMPPD